MSDNNETLQEKLQLLSIDIIGQVANLKAKVASGQDFLPELNALENAGSELEFLAGGVQSNVASAKPTQGTVTVTPPTSGTSSTSV